MSRSQRFHKFMDLYTTGMLPSAIPIGLIAGREGYNRGMSRWESFGTAMVGAAFYPITMSYLVYKTYKDEPF
nr:putative membrane protein [Cedratvirus lena]WIL04991.1 putative membrane protein [Cedratvirus duvanny]